MDVKKHYIALGGVAAGVAAGAVLSRHCRRRELEGRYVTISRRTGMPNGDKYEFRKEGDVYKVYRGGRFKSGEYFTVEGNKIKHNKGPSGEILPNGDIQWDVEGGKWISRPAGSWGGPAAVAKLFVPPIVTVALQSGRHLLPLRGAASAAYAPAQADLEAPQLVLVQAGSPDACVFEHAAALATGEEFVPLTTTDGKAIVYKALDAVRFAHFHLLTPGVGRSDVAVRARLDKEKFLTVEHSGFVFDVDKWQYRLGNRLWILREHSDAAHPATRNPEGGRSFVLNEDGTISPTAAPGLVLGMWSEGLGKSKPETTYAAKDVPPTFALPTAGKTFLLASPFDNEKVMEIFAHQPNCPLVFSPRKSTWTHWFVKDFDPKDEAFRLAIQTESGELYARLDVLDRPGEAPKAVRSEGTWFLAEKHEDNKVRIRARGVHTKSISKGFFGGSQEPPPALPLYLTCAEKTKWGGFEMLTTNTVSEANLLVLKELDGGDEDED